MKKTLSPTFTIKSSCEPGSIEEVSGLDSVIVPSSEDTSDEDAKTSVVTITVGGESVKKKINSGPDQNARSSMNDVVSDHRTTGRWPQGWEPVSVNENLDRVVSINAGDLTQFKGKKRLEIVGAALENLRDAVVQLSERVDKLEVKGSDGS